MGKRASQSDQIDNLGQVRQAINFNRLVADPGIAQATEQTREMRAAANEYGD